MNRPELICFPVRRISPFRHPFHRFATSGRHGFTLIEVLVAVTLTLVMMAAVVQIFAIVGESINKSRSTLEMSERIRAVASRLRLDLEGVTADMIPPARPEEGKGYFEIIEGPIGRLDPTTDPLATPGYNTDEPGSYPSGFTPDSTVGDRDDILQFTTRSRDEQFVGRFSATNVARSQVAEVSWFLRSTTLYRRVLLVAPSLNANILFPATTDSLNMGFYNNYDLSVHWDEVAGRVVCNTLADLTRRECRYAHPPKSIDGTLNGFPYALHLTNYGNWQALGLPTLQECSHAAWPFPLNGRMPYNSSGTSAVMLTPQTPTVGSPADYFDAWINPYPVNELSEKDAGSINLSSNPPEYYLPLPGGYPLYPTAAVSPPYVGPRVGEDVILTNVLSFDVKAWDPEAPILQAVNDNGTPILTDDKPITNSAVVQGDKGYFLSLKHLINSTPLGVILSRGAYVDLGYSGTALSDFSGPPNPKYTITLADLRIWDTWSIHYEHDGVDQNNNGIADEGTNGFDDNVGSGANGVVDDPSEREAPPPYDAPLRGIQIKIRVFDPDSQQVREVTVRHDFLKK